ncbi:MAG: TRAP transporter substrate-binding protein DctP [Chromatiales bacterium]|nr:TRAP transporter substrate-binding protein DctP [Chromatiales bacterium]
MLRRLATLLIITLLPITAQATTTFKIATVVPDGTGWMTAMRAGAEEIKTRTGGRVEFRFYPGGVMGNDASVLRKMRVGQLHGGALSSGGIAMLYPEAQVYTIPFFFQDYQEVDYARGKMDAELIAGLKEKGYISFGITEGGFSYLMSNNPVYGIDEMKELKVWVPEGDDIARTAFETSGISPISLPITDVLTGLQTGLIDTVANSPVGTIALQWHTRVKYLTHSPLLYVYGSMVVSEKQFNKLSAADQQVVSEVMGEVFRKLDKQNRKDNEGALQALKQQGITFITPSAEETQRWRDSLNIAMEKLMAKGLFDPAMNRKLEGHVQTFRSTARAK